MKTYTIVLFVLTSLLFTQCKKEGITPMPDEKTTFLLQTQQFVKEKMLLPEYEQLDWKHAHIYQQNGVNQIVRVPLLGNTHPSQKAVYLTYANNSFSGNYFELANNAITTISLDNVRKCVAPLTADGRVDGYRVYENGQLIKENEAMRNAVYIIRPPVQLYDFNYNLYYLIETLGLGQGGNGEANNAPQGVVSYLSAIPDGGELGEGGGGGGLSGEIIDIDYYDGDSKPAVDIVKLFKCYEEVPDFPGTTYEMILHADVPVNSNPTKPMDLNFSPGHVFITITKSNPVKSVTQNFGWYPVSGTQSLGLTDVPSKVVNDEFHESNAQIKIQITQYDFDLIKANAIYEAGLLYNLKTNNCADFALRLFNLARPNNPIILPLFTTYFVSGTALIPNVVINNSPQALFAVLDLKKTNNSTDAPFIKIDQSKSTKSAASNGECN